MLSFDSAMAMQTVRFPMVNLVTDSGVDQGRSTHLFDIVGFCIFLRGSDLLRHQKHMFEMPASNQFSVNRAGKFLTFYTTNWRSSNERQPPNFE